MDIRYEYRNIHFSHSSQWTKKEFKAALAEARATHPEHPVLKRSNYSLLIEWATHKVLFKLGIKPDRTESVDCDLDETTIRKIGYFAIGTMALIFLK